MAGEEDSRSICATSGSVAPARIHIALLTAAGAAIAAAAGVTLLLASRNYPLRSSARTLGAVPSFARRFGA